MGSLFGKWGVQEISLEAEQREPIVYMVLIFK